jgi:membrane associated rhomboid family serine protease
MAEAVEQTCYRHPDRVTGLSCSECGRPICTECMTMAPVGIRCPEHSGKPQGVQRVTRGVQRAAFEGTGAKVTKALVAINVAVYVAELVTGGGVNGTGSTIYLHGVLYGPLVEQGDWWRLLTAAFLHYGPVHLLLNMLGLYWFGSLLEQRIGAARAIFGILGAGLVLERQRDYVFGGSAMGVILINFVFTFSISSISKGGHIGGLLGGILCALGLTRFGRGHAAYGRPGVLGVATIVLVGIASIAIAYWRVTSYRI